MMEIKRRSNVHIQRLRPTPHWSDATIFNGIAHFVEVAADTEQDIAGQAAQLLCQTEKTLADIGSDKSHLLSATIYLTDAQHASTFNQLWEAWLPVGCAPSRACILVNLLDPKMLVEIAFVAAT